MKRRLHHRVRGSVVGLLACLTLLASGCSLGKDLYSTPLPGGADVGDHPLEITADFDDVVDLVPQSAVKVENIAVGRIDTIELNEDGRSARATLLVRGDVALPEGTTARLQQTSLLGEKYIALIRPDENDPGAELLTTGAHIPISDTSQVAEMEQVLGALSLVVNGGGLAEFRNISRELQQVSSGRPEEIRAFLRNTEAFVSSLDERKGDITDAVDAMAKLSSTLDRDRDKIAKALEDLSPGLQVLADQRGQLVKMLKALDELGKVSIRTLDASQEDMVEDMKLLEPILGEFAKAGDALPNSLELLLTYPFPDSVLDAIKGDYLNVFATANYSSLPDSCTKIGCAWSQYPDTGATPPIDPFTYGESISEGAGVSVEGSAKQQPKSQQKKQPKQKPAAPSLLPATDSALPGLPTPTVQVPSPSATPSASPSGTPSSTPSGSPSGTPSGPPSGSPSGSPSTTTQSPAPSSTPSQED